MKVAFARTLKPLLDAVAQQFELYVPKKSGEHFVFVRYDAAGPPPDYNNIRSCMPVKEFLFPMRELAALFPDSGVVTTQQKPFAIFGLKDCDLRSLEILDRVFKEEEFVDPFYAARRDSMFTISSDCSEPGKSCCCNLFDGQSYPQKGFDLNISKVAGGFVVEAGSEKGQEFLDKHKQLFAEPSAEVLAERDAARARTEKQLAENSAGYQLDSSIREIMENSQDSEVFDAEAKNCVECQACTRICPTCHCFYLYDTSRDKYFAKMKMWDSCMRQDYAKVAGGANPRKILGERLKHRLMHKFVYFLDRYGINMCVGCGRCIDADAGGMDIREVLRKLNQQMKTPRQAKVTK
jgi:ferredoxin